MTKKQYLFKIVEYTYELLGEKLRKIKVCKKDGAEIETYVYKVLADVAEDEKSSIQEELDALAEKKSKEERLKVEYKLYEQEPIRIHKYGTVIPVLGEPIIELIFSK